MLQACLRNSPSTCDKEKERDANIFDERFEPYFSSYVKAYEKKFDVFAVEAKKPSAKNRGDLTQILPNSVKK